MYTYIVCAVHLSTIEDKEKSEVVDGTEETRHEGIHSHAVATLNYLCSLTLQIVR